MGKKAKRKVHEVSMSENESDSGVEQREITDASKETSINASKKAKKKAHHKTAGNVDGQDAENSNTVGIEDSDSSLSTENQAVEFRYRPDDGFVMRTETKTELCTEDLKGKDLWLIKAPVDFDMKSLNGQNVCLNGLQPLNTDTKNAYEVHAFEDKNLNFSALQPMLPCRHKKTFQPASKFKGQIHIIQTIAVPPLPKIVVPKPIKHEVLAGLELRYKPFGSESPRSETSEPEHHRKQKRCSEEDRESKRSQISAAEKHRKRKDYSEKVEETESSSKRKKKKKKHKHH